MHGALLAEGFATRIRSSHELMCSAAAPVKFAPVWGMYKNAPSSDPGSYLWEGKQLKLPPPPSYERSLMGRVSEARRFQLGPRVTSSLKFHSLAFCFPPWKSRCMLLPHTSFLLLLSFKTVEWEKIGIKQANWESSGRSRSPLAFIFNKPRRPVNSSKSSDFLKHLDLGMVFI